MSIHETHTRIYELSKRRLTSPRLPEYREQLRTMGCQIAFDQKAAKITVTAGTEAMIGQADALAEGWGWKQTGKSKLVIGELEVTNSAI